MVVKENKYQCRTFCPFFFAVVGGGKTVCCEVHKNPIINEISVEAVVLILSHVIVWKIL